MPLNAAGMTNEIVTKLPSEWQPYWVDGQAPKAWVRAMCDDIVMMWDTWAALGGGAMTPGVIGPHVHATMTPFAAVTTALSALGYTPAALSYFTGLMGVVAIHFSNPAMLVTNSNSGALTHDHALPPLPAPRTTAPLYPFAATASTLQTALKAAAIAAGALGAPMPDQGNQNSLDLLFKPISEGIVEHVAANGDVATSIDAGLGHVHIVS